MNYIIERRGRDQWGIDSAYWTGAKWSKDLRMAKRFGSRERAEKHMRENCDREATVSLLRE